MKYLFLCSIILLTTVAHGQSSLERYKTLIDLDGDYEIVRSNMSEVESLDLSPFWTQNSAEQRLGFIGSKYRRLRIQFLSIIKNPDHPAQYLVYGKNKVSNNISEFQGFFEIKESCYVSTAEFSDSTTGILVGDYTFYEDATTSHAGIFKGKFVTYWYKDKSGNIQYNDLWSGAAGYNNNQFSGIWTGYKDKRTLVVNWGDSRIPLSGDLDVGTSEFAVNPKYLKNGWETFEKAQTKAEAQWWRSQ